MTEIGLKELGAKFFALPPEKQVEVLDFIDFILTKSRTTKFTANSVTVKKRPFRSVYGIYAGAGVKISEQDIDKLRQEIWSEFPREEPREQ